MRLTINLFIYPFRSGLYFLSPLFRMRFDKYIFFYPFRSGLYGRVVRVGVDDCEVKLAISGEVGISGSH